MKRLALIALALLLTLPALAQPTAEDLEALQRLYGQRQYEQLRVEATALLADHPDDRAVHHYLGRALTDLGEAAAARPHLEACIAGDERDWMYAWSLFYLGAEDIVTGNDERGAARWREVRDGAITRNVARQAANNLRAFGLDESMADWPVRDTDHLHLVFSPQLADRDLDRYADLHEKGWHLNTAAFGGAPEHRTRYIVWHDLDEAKQVAGIGSLGFAKPEYNLIHCLWEQTVGHELAHVICYHALEPVARTGLINEGLAVAHDLTGRDQLARARATCAELGVPRVDLCLVWNDPRQIDQELFYPVAGAWIQFLQREVGRDVVLELGRDQTLDHARQVIGPGFDELVGRFEAALVAGE